MSGVAVPQYIITQPFGNPAVTPTDPGGATLPVPVPSQIGVIVGAASFEDGFPAATMVNPETQGGVPPYGQDFNGLMYMITAYCALLQAGEKVNYDLQASTAFGGYAVGAQVASTAVAGLVWTNYTDGNTNNPDLDSTGWAASYPLRALAAPTAGAHADYVLPGMSDYALDIDSSAGNIDFSGFVAQRNGQKIFLSNIIGANLVQVLALNGGSAANNQIRAATDLALVTNQTLTLQWVAGVNKWILV